ncbi:MAG: spore germination protein [Bacteroidales bacterium]|nr:spore germination protein [Clostridium sp.]MCM1203457.1 spore germination protein [Bacteroidales bacterium]
MEIKYNEKNELELPIDKHLEKNIEVLDAVFSEWGDIVKKKFILERENTCLQMYIIYVDGLTDNEMVERTITHPLIAEWRNTTAGGSAAEAASEKVGKSAAEAESEKGEGEKNGEAENSGEAVFRQIFHHESEAVDLTEGTSMMEAINAVLKGDTAIFLDGEEKVMILSTKKLPTRSVDSPQKEGGLKGPRDSFNENFRTSTALLRRRVKDAKMKLKQGQLGQRSRTVYGLMYMEDLVYPSLLERIEKKLNSFTIDGIFDSGMLVHLLEEKWYSPFPQVQTTERPDKAASAILEGRVVLVVDNSPEVIILPTTLNTFFQAADDYYNRFAVATFARCLRYLAAYITVLLPGLYIAITCYYPQVLPTDFLLAIAGARSDVTFPIVVEVLLMELLFELLREAGIRLPGQMGNTIGVVGGLIVGQAAVEASLVSTIVVIVVALTAIASFAIPNEEFSSTFRLLKFLMIFLGAVWGLYGIMLGLLVLQIHLSSMESFGIPYMMPLVSGSIDDELEFQDFILRKPIFTMHNRPLYTRRKMRTRFRRY